MNTQASTQDIFLNQLRKERVPITVFLTSGHQLKGSIKGFDSFVIILEGFDKTGDRTVDRKQSLIYKHAISSIVPAKPLNLDFTQS